MDRLAWLLSADLGREKLALLVACAMAIYVLATNLSWRLFYVGTGHKLVTAIGRSGAGQWMTQITRLLYYVGIPLAVLWRRELVRQMGIPTTWGDGAAFYLLGLDGPRDIMRVGAGIAMGAGVLCVLVAVWIWYARMVPGVDKRPAMPWWKALREAIFLQVSWAFYRGFASTLTPDNTYAAFLGLALVAVPWLFDPVRRNDVRGASQGCAVVRDWMLALFTALIATKIHLLWLLILMHSVWLWAGDQVLKSAFGLGADSTKASRI